MNEPDWDATPEEHAANWRLVVEDPDLAEEVGIYFERLPYGVLRYWWAPTSSFVYHIPDMPEGLSLGWLYGAPFYFGDEPEGRTDATRFNLAALGFTAASRLRA